MTSKTAYLDNRDTIGREDVGGDADGTKGKRAVGRLSSGGGMGHGDDGGGGPGGVVFGYGMGVPFSASHCDSNISPGYSPTPSTPHYELFYPAFAPTIHPNMKFRYFLYMFSSFGCHFISFIHLIMSDQHLPTDLLLFLAQLLILLIPSPYWFSATHISLSSDWELLNTLWLDSISLCCMFAHEAVLWHQPFYFSRLIIIFEYYYWECWL